MGLAQVIGLYFTELVFTLTIFLTTASEYPPFIEFVANYENGETQIEKIKDYCRIPEYGLCWTSALDNLYQSCERLTEVEQSRMALAFTNCLLEMAEFDTYHCSDSEPLSKCLNKMKGDIFALTTFAEFFTHSRDMCFFLQSQI